MPAKKKNRSHVESLGSYSVYTTRLVKDLRDLRCTKDALNDLADKYLAQRLFINWQKEKK